MAGRGRGCRGAVGNDKGGTRKRRTISPDAEMRMYDDGPTQICQLVALLKTYRSRSASATGRAKA